MVAAWLKHEGSVVDAMRFAREISDTSITRDPNKRSFEVKVSSLIYLSSFSTLLTFVLQSHL